MKTTKPKITHLEDHVGYWLSYISKYVSAAFMAKLALHHITIAEWLILRMLFDSSCLSPGTIARRTNMTRGAITKVIDSLVTKQLVSRNPSAVDRRSQQIALTAIGHKLVPLLTQLADDNEAYFFAHLSAPQKKQLVDLLKDIAQRCQLQRIPLNCPNQIL